MPPDWREDHEHSRRCLPHMKQIIGHYLIAEAPMSEDAHHNTDLIVLELRGIRVACRVRAEEEYYAKYGDEFTIRCSRPNGVETELSKVIAGWGDYILYGFAPKRHTFLTAWGLGDLNVFRLWFNRELARDQGRTPGELHRNHDRSSDFRAFKWNALPDGFVIANHRIGRAERTAA